MTPTEPENHLPRALRDSKLPWKPRFDDQAASPRPDDGWTADLGGLRLELDLDSAELDLPDGTPALRLRLLEQVVDREVRSWDPPDLHTAAHVAEAVVDLLLEQLGHDVLLGLRLLERVA